MSINLVYELQALINSASESDTDKGIALYLLKNIQRVEDITINELANECYTSISTVSRFCKTIGLANFAELKQRIGEFRLTSYESMSDNLEGLNFQQGNDVLVNYTSEIGNALSDFASSIDFEVLDQIISLMHQSDRVIVYATQLPAFFAKYFQYLMLLQRKYIEFYDLQEDSSYSASQLTDKDCAMVFSAEGNFIVRNRQVMIQILQTSAKKVLFTQNPGVKFIERFDQVLFLGKRNAPKMGRYKIQLLVEVLVNRYYYYLENLSKTENKG